MKDQPAKMLVTMTQDELELAMERAVSKRVAEEVERATGPRFMTTAELAEMLSMSTKTVVKLTRDGLPSLRLGRELRFETARVVEWLRAHGSNDQSPQPRTKKATKGHLRSV